MEISVGMWLEPDDEHKRLSWALRYKWPMMVEEVDDWGAFYLKGAKGSWSATGLVEVVTLENK